MYIDENKKILNFPRLFIYNYLYEKSKKKLFIKVPYSYNFKIVSCNYFTQYEIK